MNFAYHPLGLAAALCGLLAVNAPAQAAAINGAIYTSNADATAINANQYPSKDDVYLNGGPSNASCNGGLLPAGDFYFQVTSPSGDVLLSQDSIFDRGFRVSNGRIAENLGTHAVGSALTPCGSLPIQLMPYADTPNNGGVYKVWITRQADFHAACGGPDVDCGLAGFVPGSTKTDNFMVATNGGGEEPDPTGTLNAYKFYDANANGVWDDGEAPLENWLIRISPLTGLLEVEDTKATDIDGLASWTGLEANEPDDFTYTVTEGTPVQTNWFTLTANPASGLNVYEGEITNVLFGNFCLVANNGSTLGFWSNRNGERRVDAADLAALRELNLRNADGSHFDPTTYAQLRTWLLNGTATNMAYMLSVQLAATVLSERDGDVSGADFYIPAGMTIADLIATANDALGANGLTTSGSPDRAEQGMLKDWLDQLNNDAPVVPATPCDYDFDDSAFPPDEDGGEPGDDEDSGQA